MAEEKWWETDEHPDAKDHREALAKAEHRAKPQIKSAVGYLTLKDFDWHMEKSYEFLATDVFKPLAVKIAALEKRIAELEARPAGLDYRGVYRAGTAYGRNAGVSCHGSLWVARRDHPGKPGEPNSGWQLAVKRGADAK